jgi:hypothetical protein
MGMATGSELGVTSTPPSVRSGLHRNIFSIYGTALPPNVLLMTKIVIVACLGLLYKPVSGPYLPFVALLDGPIAHKILLPILVCSFVFGALCVLFNTCVRSGCLVTGLSVLVSMAASRAFYSNNMLYGALLLILAGLYEQRLRTWTLRLQTAIMYLGAGLNKLLEPDWRSGQFFQHWFGETHQHAWFIKAGAALPPLVFSQLTSWSIICLELAFAPFLLYRRTAPLAMWTVIAYHTAVLALTGSTFGIFYFSIAASMLAFVDWPQRPFSICFKNHGIDRVARSLLRILDPDAAFVVSAPAQCGDQSCVLEVENDREVGAMAVLRALSLCPATYFLVFLLIRLPESVLYFRRPFAVVMVLLFLPIALRSTARNFGISSLSRFLGPQPARNLQK